MSARVLDPDDRDLRSTIWDYIRRGANLSEVAALLMVDPSTFRSFILSHPKIQRVVAHARSTGNMELRTAQHDMALDPENRFAGPMLIWLGKNRLMQADREAPAPEPIPGIEESQDIRTFADLATVANELEDKKPLPLSEGDNKYVVIDVEEA